MTFFVNDICVEMIISYDSQLTYKQRLSLSCVKFPTISE